MLLPVIYNRKITFNLFGSKIFFLLSCFLLTLLKPVSAYSGEQIIVDKLFNGACWFGEEDFQFEIGVPGKIFSYTNFNTKISNSISTPDMPFIFHPAIEKAMKDNGIPSYAISNYEIWLYCSVFEAKLILNFKESQPNLVMHIDDASGVLEVFSNNEAHSGFNFGQLPLKLLMYLDGNSKPRAVKKRLQKKYGKYIKSVSYSYIELIDFYQYEIHLNESYKYSEAILKSLLEKDKVLEKGGWVEYDSIVLRIGEPRMIHIDQFPGF